MPDKDRFFARIPVTPVPLNRYRKMHWAAQSREVKRWRQLFYAHGVHRTAPHSMKALVTVRVDRIRLQDEDNFHGSLKPLFDALVQNRVLMDDNHEWCERDCSEFKAVRGQCQTTVEVLYRKPKEKHPARPETRSGGA